MSFFVMGASLPQNYIDITAPYGGIIAPNKITQQGNAMATAQLRIRLPQELKNWVKERAKENMRPMNSEITLLLQAVKGQIERKEEKQNT